MPVVRSVREQKMGIMTYFCILSQLVEKPDIALIACYRDFSSICGCGSRKIILGSILFELAFDEFVTGNPGINTEKTVVCYHNINDGQGTYLQWPIKVCWGFI